MPKVNFPDTLYVVRDDSDDHGPIYIAYTSLDDVPENADDQLVGVFTLSAEKVLRVKRELV